AHARSQVVAKSTQVVGGERLQHRRHSRTTASASSGMILLSKRLRTFCLSWRPLGRRQAKEPSPHLSRTAQVTQEERPQPANLVGVGEQPYVTRIRFSKQHSEPVGS